MHAPAQLPYRWPTSDQVFVALAVVVITALVLVEWWIDVAAAIAAFTSGGLAMRGQRSE